MVIQHKLPWLTVTLISKNESAAKVNRAPAALTEYAIYVVLNRANYGWYTYVRTHAGTAVIEKQ